MWFILSNKTRVGKEVSGKRNHRIIRFSLSEALGSKSSIPPPRK
jgi:hypothetical protein